MHQKEFHAKVSPMDDLIRKIDVSADLSSGSKGLKKQPVRKAGEVSVGSDALMRSLIQAQAEKAQSFWGYKIGIFLCFLILIGALTLVWISRETLEVNMMILLGGVAIAGLIGVVTLSLLLRMSRQQERDKNRWSALYMAAFFGSPVPSLITEQDRPIQANRAYLDLAERLGVQLIGDLPPSIDRLFVAADETAAVEIFQLYHLADDTPQGSTTIDMVNQQNDLCRYHLQVTRLLQKSPASSSQMLWQLSEDVDAQTVEKNVLTEAPVGLFTILRNGQILATNNVLNRWVGGAQGTAPEKLSDFIDAPETLLDSPVEPGRTVRTDTRLVTKKGVKSPTVMVANWHKLSSGDMVASVALYGHSTLSRGESLSPQTSPQMQANMGTDDALSSQAYMTAPVAVLQLKGQNIGSAKIMSANPAFAKMSAIEDVSGQTFADIFPAEPSSQAFLSLDKDALVQDQSYDTTLKTHRAGQEEAGLPVSVYIVNNPIAPMESFAYLVNVSARKALEDQLVQSQKMQAIGQLAAGVAHDFNNLLTAIRLNTDELLQRHPVGDPSYPELQSINTTGARAAALVKKLLTFSRKATRREERLDVTETLSDMIVTLRQTLGERAKLEMIHARGLPAVMADKSQIDTVLMNLCVNARDAMQAQGGGKITIRSALLKRADIPDENLLNTLSTIGGDEFVVISVSDTGSGMSEDVKAKIFEPFFTTKEQGKGTGLGLATVYGIVQQTGGHLDVHSTLGQGTTFRIFLPVAPAATEPSEIGRVAAPTMKAPPVRQPSDLAGQGNILFVEDEAAVRGIAAKALRKKGYKVVEAEDGEEALEILEETKTPFDLMISDVVMPGMDGPSLLRAGRPLLGDARIVFISGYAEEEFSELLAEEPDVTFLPKPFTFAELAEKVKSEIGEAE